MREFGGYCYRLVAADWYSFMLVLVVGWVSLLPQLVFGLVWCLVLVSDCMVLVVVTDFWLLLSDDQTVLLSLALLYLLDTMLMYFLAAHLFVDKGNWVNARPRGNSGEVFHEGKVFWWKSCGILVALLLARQVLLRLSLAMRLKGCV